VAEVVGRVAELVVGLLLSSSVARTVVVSIVVLWWGWLLAAIPDNESTAQQCKVVQGVKSGCTPWKKSSALVIEI